MPAGNNVITSIKNDCIFMDSENNKTSKPHVLILNLTDKMDSKYQLQHVMLNLNYQMDHT